MNIEIARNINQEARKMLQQLKGTSDVSNVSLLHTKIASLRQRLNNCCKSKCSGGDGYMGWLSSSCSNKEMQLRCDVNRRNKSR